MRRTGDTLIDDNTENKEIIISRRVVTCIRRESQNKKQARLKPSLLCGAAAQPLVFI